MWEKQQQGGKKEKYIIQQGIKRQRLTGNGEEETKRQITSQTERANKGERQLTEMDRMKIRQMTKSQKTGHCFRKRQRRILKGKQKNKKTHTQLPDSLPTGEKWPTRWPASHLRSLKGVELQLSARVWPQQPVCEHKLHPLPEGCSLAWCQYGWSYIWCGGSGAPEEPAKQTGACE